MRRIVTVRTLALSTALILALGGVGCAGAEDTSEPSSAEASEEAADETSAVAEKPDTEASEADEE